MALHRPVPRRHPPPPPLQPFPARKLGQGETMASKRPHPNGSLIRWREPTPSDPRLRTQRSWVCSDSDAQAEVYREEAERAEQAGEGWCPPDRRPRPGRTGVGGEVAVMVAEHG